MEVVNIFITRHHDINNAERVPIIINWLERETLQFLKL